MLEVVTLIKYAQCRVIIIIDFANVVYLDKIELSCFYIDSIFNLENFTNLLQQFHNVLFISWCSNVIEH
jgi:hypothetical protein